MDIKWHWQWRDCMKIQWKHQQHVVLSRTMWQVCSGLALAWTRSSIYSNEKRNVQFKLLFSCCSGLRHLTLLWCSLSLRCMFPPFSVSCPARLWAALVISADVTSLSFTHHFITLTCSLQHSCAATCGDIPVKYFSCGLPMFVYSNCVYLCHSEGPISAAFSIVVSGCHLFFLLCLGYVKDNYYYSLGHNSVSESDA